MSTHCPCGKRIARGAKECIPCRSKRLHEETLQSMPHPNPSGLCMCGCGNPAPVAFSTQRSIGNIKGLPQRYINGHATRKSPVDYVVTESGCWEWQLALLPNGYGKIKRGGKTRGAHVVFYEQAHGPVPPRCEIDHICRNRRCVNPDHLEAVTHKQNVRRGRNTILTQDEVDEIRSLGGVMLGKDIAAKFGISRGHVSEILSGKLWKPD